MKNKYFFLLVFFFNIGLVFSQNTRENIDSEVMRLNQLLSSPSMPAIEEVKGKAAELALQAETIKYRKGLADCFKLLSSAYEKEGNSKMAKRFASKAQKVVENISVNEDGSANASEVAAVKAELIKKQEHELAEKNAQIKRNEEALQSKLSALDQLSRDRELDKTKSNRTIEQLAKEKNETMNQLIQKNALLSQQELLLMQAKTQQELAEEQLKTAEQEKKLKELEINRQKILSQIMIAGFAFMLLVIGGLIYTYRKIQTKNKALSKALDDLKNAQNRLVESQKLAALGQMTAGIAHEIQNPLNFVNNFSESNLELLQEYSESTDEEERSDLFNFIIENTSKVLHHGKRADSIVKSMLMHSRDKKEERESVDINQLIEQTINLSFHGIKATDKAFNAAMKIELDNSIPNTMAVKQDLSRVMLNLFNNSFYSVKKQRLNMPKTYQPEVKVSTIQKDGMIKISIHDNGLGISDENQKKVFTPFFTTKPTGEGTGLGLSICFDIIQKQHNGKLEVFGKENEFAEFVISIPILEK